MNTLSRYLDDAYSTWLGMAASCCSVPAESARQPLRRGQYTRPGASPRKSLSKIWCIDGEVRPMRIEHHQPHLVPPPIPEPQERPATRGSQWVDRTRSFASRASSRGSFSVRRRLNAYNGPRRPRIGAPSDFRHVDRALPSRAGGAGGSQDFRPLELSIYTEEQPSPLLPLFSTMEPLPIKEMAYPPSVVTHARSESSMSFQIPRKPVRSSSIASSQWTSQFQARPVSLSAQELLAKLESEMPKAPPPARLRSNTEPPTYERIKSALHEKFELEQKLKDIDEVIEERKSIYMNSRPTSRATSRARSIYSNTPGK
jgi:hypothetical protein